jgi:hypothetical protein
MRIRMLLGTDGQPQVLLTIQDDDGNDLVYRYEPIAAATP